MKLLEKAAKVLVFIDIRRCLRDKNFDIVWGYHPSGNFPNGPKRINYFWMTWAVFEYFWISVGVLWDNFFLRGLEVPTCRNLPKSTYPKITFWKLNLTILILFSWVHLLCWHNGKGASVWNCRDWTGLCWNT